MKLSKKDVFMVVDHAKREILHMPARVVIGGEELSEINRVGLAYFRAACQVLGSLGIDTTPVEIKYDQEENFSLDEYESDHLASSE